MSIVYYIFGFYSISNIIFIEQNIVIDQNICEMPAVRALVNAVGTAYAEPLPEQPVFQQVAAIPGAAASILAKIKPFTRESYAELKARIEERKRRDHQNNSHQGESLKNDPKLADRKFLPRSVARHFPKCLLGVPIEEID